MVQQISTYRHSSIGFYFYKDRSGNRSSTHRFSRRDTSDFTCQYWRRFYGTRLTWLVLLILVMLTFDMIVLAVMVIIIKDEMFPGTLLRIMPTLPGACMGMLPTVYGLPMGRVLLWHCLPRLQSSLSHYPSPRRDCSSPHRHKDNPRRCCVPKATHGTLPSRHQSGSSSMSAYCSCTRSSCDTTAFNTDTSYLIESQWVNLYPDVAWWVKLLDLYAIDYGLLALWWLM